MSELTDLEICKKIAEIEGLQRQGFELTPYRVGKLVRAGNFVEWNPLIDKALCFDLMVKYKIILSGTFSGGYRAEWSQPLGCENKNPQRAICLAIISKHSQLHGK